MIHGPNRSNIDFFSISWGEKRMINRLLIIAMNTWKISFKAQNLIPSVQNYCVWLGVESVLSPRERAMSSEGRHNDLTSQKERATIAQ